MLWGASTAAPVGVTGRYGCSLQKTAGNDAGRLFAGLSTIEAYNTKTDEWFHVLPMSTRRSSVGVGVVNGEYVAKSIYYLKIKPQLYTWGGMFFFQVFFMLLEDTMGQPGSVSAQLKPTILKATRGATSLKWARDAAEQVCVCVCALSLIDWQTPRNDIGRSRCFALLRCRCVKRFTVRRRGPRWAAGEEELRSLRSDHQQLATGGGHEHVSAQRG